MKKLLFTMFLLLPNLALANQFQQEIDNRQFAFKTVEENSDEIASQLRKSDIDWAALEILSAALVEQTLVLQSAFPEGSTEGSKARSAVWEKPEKFEGLLTQLDGGMNSLHESVLAKDKSGAQDAIKEGLKTCKSCHRGYRARR